MPLSESIPPELRQLLIGFAAVVDNPQLPHEQRVKALEDIRRSIAGRQFSRTVPVRKVESRYRCKGHSKSSSYRSKSDADDWLAKTIASLQLAADVDKTSISGSFDQASLLSFVMWTHDVTVTWRHQNTFNCGSCETYLETVSSTQAEIISLSSLHSAISTAEANLANEQAKKEVVLSTCAPTVRVFMSAQKGSEKVVPVSDSNSSIQTDKGEYRQSDFKRDAAFSRAVTTGRGTMCRYPACSLPKCNFLHLKYPEHSRPTTNNVPGEAAARHHATPASLPKTNRHSKSLPLQVAEELQSFNDDPTQPVTIELIQSVITALELLCTELYFIRTLQKLLTPRESAPGSTAPIDVHMGKLITQSCTWASRCDTKAIPMKFTKQALSLFLLILERSHDISLPAVDNIYQYCKACEASQESKEVQMACERKYEQTSQKKEATPLNLHRPALRYPDLERDIAALAKLPVLCCEDDFADARNRDDIIRSLQPIIVDAPIPHSQAKHHLRALFTLYREDYVASVRAAVRVVRKCVPHNMQLDRGISLPRNIQQDIKEGDEKKDVRLYLNLTCEELTVSREKGVVFTFRIDPRQFEGRKVNWDRRMMSGNLILLSSTYFSKNSPILCGTIERQRPKKEFPPKRYNRDDIPFETFEVCFENATADFIDKVGNNTVYSALESTSFFVPYQRILCALQQISEGTLPLESALLAAETQHVPRYIEQNPRFNIGGCVKIAGDPMVNVLQPDEWKRCEPWSADNEASNTDSRKSYVDPTQAAALEHLFSHNVAVIQGTPGTGKTFIGAKFMRILLDNFELLRSPILCICYTNHAVDAFLRSILEFEDASNIVRLGSSSKDPQMAPLALLPKLPPRSGERDHYQNVDAFEDLSQELSCIENAKQPNYILTNEDFESMFDHVNCFNVVSKLLGNLMDEQVQRKIAMKRLQETIRKVDEKIKSQEKKLLKYPRFKEANSLEKHQLKQLEAKRRLEERNQEYAAVLINTKDLELQKETPAATIVNVIALITQLNANIQNLDEQASKLKAEGDHGGRTNNKKKKKGKNKKTTPASEEETATVTHVANQLTILEESKKAFQEELNSLNQLQNVAQELVKEEKIFEENTIDPVQEREIFVLHQVLKECKAEKVSMQNNLDTIISKGTKSELHLWVSSAALSTSSSSVPAPLIHHHHTQQSNNRPSTAPAYEPTSLDDAANAYSEMQRNAQAEARQIDNGPKGDTVAIQSEEYYSPAAVTRELEKIEHHLKQDAAYPAGNRLHRDAVYKSLLFLWECGIRRRIMQVVRAITKQQNRIRTQRSTQTSNVLKQHRVIAGTTAGCATLLEALRLTRPKVVIVEEAAEVLESHVLACLTEGVQHLILIGDHKQLQPKVEEEFTLGKKKNLSISLMERMVRIGAPYVTLTTQRRMHPEISEFTKLYYKTESGAGDHAVDIVDHPHTNRRSLPVGVKDRARVLFVNHRADQGPKHQEQRNEQMQSFFNTFEAELAVSIAQYLSLTNRSATITILLPYAAQVLKTIEMIKQHSSSVPRASPGSVPNRELIQIHSIDDYQGEESDFVILSLTRTTKEGFQKGFLKIQNRACVALSRARCGLYIIGCLEELRACPNPIWAECIRLVERDGRVADAFPAVCDVHGEDLSFTSVSSRKSCTKLCMLPLDGCTHHCQKVCHQGDDNHMKCAMPCERLHKTCLHKCKKKCSQDCGTCIENITVTCPDCTADIQILCHEKDTFQCTAQRTKPGTCSAEHAVTAPCFEWKDGTAYKRCTQRCNELMPCTHICLKRCHHGKDDDHRQAAAKCMEPKSILHPSCKMHNITVPCSKPIDNKLPPCTFQCAGTVSACGHPCERKCFQCDQETGKRHLCLTGMQSQSCRRCGETSTFLCRDTERICPTSCSFVLPCGHKCPGTCGTCQGSSRWYDHLSCKSSCDSINACGHRCLAGCNSNGNTCPPCEAPCDFRCGHGMGCKSAKTKHSCSSCPARRCQNTCQWQCQHQRCSKRCYEPCDRSECDEPCPQKRHLDCGHDDPCPGVCGEACPSFCRTCFKNSLADGSVYEPRQRFATMNVFVLDDEVDRFLSGTMDDVLQEELAQATNNHATNRSAFKLVELSCCSKLMIAGDLDAYMDAFMDNEKEIRSVTCPWCKQILHSDMYRRKSRIVKSRQADILQIYQRMNDEKAKQEDHQETLLENVVSGITALEFTSDVEKEDLEEALDLYSEMDRCDEPLPLKLATTMPNDKKKSLTKNYEQQKREYEANRVMLRDTRDQLRDKIKRLKSNPGGVSRMPISLQRLRGEMIDMLFTFYLFLVDDTRTSVAPVERCFNDVLGPCLDVFTTTLHRLQRVPGFVIPQTVTQLFEATAAQLHNLVAATAENGAGGFSVLSEGNVSWMRMKLQAGELIVRLSCLQAVYAEHSVMMDDTTLKPPSIPREHNIADWKVLIEDLTNQAKGYVARQRFFQRGLGHVQFIENTCLKSSCSSFQRFVNALRSNEGKKAADDPDNIRLVFHGTGTRDAIACICCRGFDTDRRSGQVHGPGEYFAVLPQTSDEYAKGSHMMLVCAVIPAEGVTRDAASGHIVVVNNPSSTSTRVQYAVALGVIGYSGQPLNPRDVLRCTMPHPETDLGALIQIILETIPLDFSAKFALSDSKVDSMLQRMAIIVDKQETVANMRPPSRKFLQTLTAAMGVTAGHWYKCAKGHLYVIGDCGGAMMQSRCPECGDVIGGGSHRLVQSNQSAADMVVAGAQAAWPGI